MKRTVDEIDFSWSVKARVPLGAVFSTLPDKVEVVAVHHDHATCRTCVAHGNYGVSNNCSEMPNCDYLTFLPNTQETVVRIVRARITGKRADR